MTKSRRANAVVFGFDFQVNAAIILMLENILDIKALRLEGNYEDIELELDDGQQILAQAKAVERGSSDFRNVRANLGKALRSLSEGSNHVQAKQLILITNSFNPLNDEDSHGIFSGPPAHRCFDTLPTSSQELIKDYLKKIENPLNLDKFMIQSLPFETDNYNERYKNILQAVDNFVGSLRLNIPGLSNQLLALWHLYVFENGSKEDAAIRLSKKDFIWPMLVIATDIDRCDEEFLSRFEPDFYDEIVHLYKETVESCCERYEFFIKVLYDYNNFHNLRNASEKCIEFTEIMWTNYLDEFSIPGIDPETQSALTKIVIYNIVRRRLTIDKIKLGVNL